MPLAISVPGAADSGRKFRTGAATERKPNWTCSNDHRNPGYATRCLTSGCNVKRPKGETWQSH